MKTFKEMNVKEKLDEAYKSVITTNEFGNSVLQPETLNQYILVAKRETTILADMSAEVMFSQIKNLDRISFGKRVLKFTQLTDADLAEISNFQNKLVAVAQYGGFGIEDSAVRRAINKEGVINQMVEDFVRSMMIDLEEISVFGDTDLTDTADDYLNKQDGLLKKVVNKVNLGAAAIDADSILGAMDKVALAVDSVYTKKRKREFSFYLDTEHTEFYRQAMINKLQVEDANRVLVGDVLPSYLGYDVTEAPVLDSYIEIGTAAPGIDPAGTDRVIYFAHRANMVWGIFAEMYMKRSEADIKFITYYTWSMEYDWNFRDENAASLGLIDVT